MTYTCCFQTVTLTVSGYVVVSKSLGLPSISRGLYTTKRFIVYLQYKIDTMFFELGLVTFTQPLVSVEANSTVRALRVEKLNHSSFRLVC